jgi:hypothetical protein
LPQKIKSQRAIAKNKINYEEVSDSQRKIFGSFVRFICGIDGIYAPLQQPVWTDY